jgi:hypothetical protein
VRAVPKTPHFNIENEADRDLLSLGPRLRETTVRACPRDTSRRSKAMGLIILLVVLILLFGGGDFYYGPPYHYYGGGLGLVLLIVVLVLLFRGRA